MPHKKKRGQVSAKAVVNNIKIGSLPSFVFSSSGNEIIPYGADNLYPQRIFEAISKSPTGKGCVKRLTEFVFGLGAKIGGEIIVNRNNETINDVLNECVQNYAKYFGFALHFNFNIFGQITEITAIEMRFPRITSDLKRVILDDWENHGQSFMQGGQVEIDIYNPDKLKELVDASGEGFEKYKGQVLYFAADHQIYPTATVDSASVSANYELESQVYTYANINNGFSANTIIKFPGMMTGTESQEEIGSDTHVHGVDQIPGIDQIERHNEALTATSKLEKELEVMHGAKNAGHSLVVEVPVNSDGEFRDFKMVENLTPTNVDDLFENQNKKAERDILKVFTMPQILLGVSDSGMFNETSFNDAFNYKNADTEGDRRIVERVFNSFLFRSVFLIKKIEIVPLKMKGEAEISVETDGVSVSGISPEQLAAQAQLKGSVGGVKGILDIQTGFSNGTTSFKSALSILQLIYGFTEEESISLLGNPEKTE